ncbi:hypothetical protein Efla_005375 [Eimeria flavescens]
MQQRGSYLYTPNAPACDSFSTVFSRRNKTRNQEDLEPPEDPIPAATSSSSSSSSSSSNQQQSRQAPTQIDSRKQITPGLATQLLIPPAAAADAAAAAMLWGCCRRPPACKQQQQHVQLLLLLLQVLQLHMINVFLPLSLPQNTVPRAQSVAAAAPAAAPGARAATAAAAAGDQQQHHEVYRQLPRMQQQQIQHLAALLASVSALIDKPFTGVQQQEQQQQQQQQDSSCSSSSTRKAAEAAAVMAGAADVASDEVAVIAGCPKGEAFLREQHQAYLEEAVAERGLSSSSSSSDNSSSSSSLLLQRPDFLDRNAAAISANSGDYTTWYLRRRYLANNPQHLNEDELRFVRAICSDSLKNYQAWFHRRWLLRRLPASSFSVEEEIASTRDTLQLDLKNYSTWAHKAFLSAAFGLPLEAEMEELETILSIDPFSNSAFSYFFCLLQRAASKAPPQEALRTWLRPIQRYTSMLQQQPTNESLVRFLVGCVKKAAAAARQQQQQQQQELQEALTLLLAAAAQVTAAGEGGERLGLELGAVIDSTQQNYRAAAAVLCVEVSPPESRRPDEALLLVLVVRPHCQARAQDAPHPLDCNFLFSMLLLLLLQRLLLLAAPPAPAAAAPATAAPAAIAAAAPAAAAPVATAAAAPAAAAPAATAAAARAAAPSAAGSGVSYPFICASSSGISRTPAAAAAAAALCLSPVSSE